MLRSASDRNEQAIHIMLSCIVVGQPINAQEVIKLTARSTVEEIKEKKLVNNVRARAK
jgi:hypothetical protein